MKISKAYDIRPDEIVIKKDRFDELIMTEIKYKAKQRHEEVRMLIKERFNNDET